MRYLGVILFGLLAAGTTIFAVVWFSHFGPLLLALSLPLWLLFFLFLIRAVRP